MTNENDWVTQDVVPDRNGFDQWRWVSPGNPNPMWNNSVEDTHVKHGQVKFKDRGTIGSNVSRAEVRCKRKDHPVLKTVVPKLVSQDELNAATKTRSWTYGIPAQTGHFLISYRDPAIPPQQITAVTLPSAPSFSVWFVYLGQTSDFVGPVVPKAKYTLLTDPKEPNGAWLRRPHEIQDALNRGWLFVTEREFEVPEWD